MLNQQDSQLKNYQMLKVLGLGGYAKVILVKEIKTEKLFAMKILKKKFIEKKRQIEHTKTERNVLVQVQNQFIVKLHHSFQNDKKLFLVLEYCQGGELFNLLQKKGRLNENQSLFYICQMIMALEHLHENNIIYRDLKPENVLIDSQGYIKITDFGLSKMNVYNDNDATSMCGTPEYLAPEILYKQKYGKSIDWWCLGCILIEMLTGNPPFLDKNKNILFEKIKFDKVQMPKNISKDLEDFITQLFIKSPDARIGSQNGAQDIKKHKWLANVNWQALKERKIKAFFIPNMKNEMDVSNFDQEFTVMSVNSSENNIFSQNSQGLDKYDNFSFIEGLRIQN